MMKVLPYVASREGTPMGRVPRHAEPETMQRFSVQRGRLNAGGYDGGGAYWGHGSPLYHIASENGEVDYFIRASNRESAKSQVRYNYPHAKFWR